MSSAAEHPWGRVDADGTVYVRTAAGERVIGQWPGGDPQEAMALYVRRFEGLEIEVDLLEKRLTGGTLGPDDAEKAVTTVREQLTDAHALGDLASLLTPPRRTRAGHHEAARGAQGCTRRQGSRGAHRQDPHRRGRREDRLRVRLARRCGRVACPARGVEGLGATRPQGRRRALAPVQHRTHGLHAPPEDALRASRTSSARRLSPSRRSSSSRPRSCRRRPTGVRRPASTAT